MKKKEQKDWSQEVSNQIAVYKTDKALLELSDSLKPASYRYPAHIHATGEKTENGERSLIRLSMLDYSAGTGEQAESIYVYANISPEETRYIYSVLFNHLMDFDYPQDKIFGEPDKDHYSMVTKLQISRYDTDKQGNKRTYPWYVEIQNGKGIAGKNAKGGTFCTKGSYVCEKRVYLYISDKDMFGLFCKADAYISVFEAEYAFRQNRIGNFTSLYGMLRQTIEAEVSRLLPHEEEPLDKAS